MTASRDKISKKRCVARDKVSKKRCVALAKLSSVCCPLPGIGRSCGRVRCPCDDRGRRSNPPRRTCSGHPPMHRRPSEGHNVLILRNIGPKVTPRGLDTSATRVSKKSRMSL